jgi:spore maturation protein CgeB
MKILYTGPFNWGGLCESRRRALVALGHEVVGVDWDRHLRRGPRIFQKLQTHGLIGPGVISYNAALRTAASQAKPDLIYIVEGTCLWPTTVKGLKERTATLVHYTSEYLGYQRYVYRHFLKTVSLYDVHVVTNPLTAQELRQSGAKRIVFTEFGYDPALHYPCEITPAEQARYDAAVVLVGHWEPAYEEKVEALRNSGIGVAVHGPGWRRSTLPERDTIRPLWGEDYLKALAGARIGMGLLSKVNHNSCAGRIFEIPAAGTFLLGERTADQLSYFAEGSEAEFFASSDELVEKAACYLRDGKRRGEVAAAGHRRCLISGYTHLDRMRSLLAEIA